MKETKYYAGWWVRDDLYREKSRLILTKNRTAEEEARLEEISRILISVTMKLYKPPE